MKLTDSHLSNDICSCTSCYYESQSCDPNVQRKLRDGSRIDRLFLGKYIPLRERKLLKRLARTRAVYDDISRQVDSCQVVDKSSECIDERYYTPRKQLLSCGECDDSEWSCVTGDFVNPVHQNNNLYGSCSCCSCDAINSHLFHQRQHVRGYTHGRCPTAASSTLRGPINVRFKSIQSEPCTCLFKISGSIKQRSKSIVEKLRKRHPQLKDHSVGQFRKLKKHKMTIPKHGESKSQFTQDESNWKVEKKSGAPKIRKKTKNTKPDTGIKRSIGTIKQPYDGESSFSISKDSIAKFKDDLESRRRNYLIKLNSKYKPCKSATPSCCLPGECDPRECCRIMEKRRKRRAIKENRVWHDDVSAIETQRYKSIQIFKESQRTSVNDIRSDVSSTSPRGAPVAKRSLSTEEIAKYHKAGKMIPTRKHIDQSDIKKKHYKVGKAIPIREDIVDKSDTKNKHKIGKSVPIRKDIIDRSATKKNDYQKTVIKKIYRNTPSQTMLRKTRYQEDNINAGVSYVSSSSKNVQEVECECPRGTQPKREKKIDIQVGGLGKSTTEKPDRMKIKADMSRLQSDTVSRSSSGNTLQEKRNKHRTSQTVLKNSMHQDSIIAIGGVSKKKIDIQVGSIGKNSPEKPERVKIKADIQTKDVKDRHSQTSISSRKSVKNVAKNRRRKCFCKINLGSLIARGIVPELDKGLVAHVCDKEVCDPNICAKFEKTLKRHSSRLVKQSGIDFKKIYSRLSAVTKSNEKPDKMKIKNDKETKHVKDKHRQRKCFCKLKLDSLIARGIVPEFDKGLKAHVCDKEVCDPIICTKFENAQERNSDRIVKRSSKDTRTIKSTSRAATKQDEKSNNIKIKAVKNRYSQISISSRKSANKVPKHRQRKCFCKMKLGSLIARGIVPELDKGLVAQVCDKEVCDPNICTKLESIQERHSGRFIKRLTADFRSTKSTSSVKAKRTDKPDKMKIKANKETKHVKDKDSHTSFSSGKSAMKVAKHRLRRCFCKMKLASLIAKGDAPELDKRFAAQICDNEVCEPSKRRKLESFQEIKKRRNDRFLKRSTMDLSGTKSTSSVATIPNKKPDKIKSMAEKEMKHVKDKHSPTSISSGKSGKRVDKHRQRKCFCKMKLGSLIARGIVPELDKGLKAHVCDKEVCDPTICTKLANTQKMRNARLVIRTSTDSRRNNSTFSAVNKSNVTPDKIKNKADKETKYVKDRHSQISIWSRQSVKKVAKHRQRKCFCKMKLDSLIARGIVPEFDKGLVAHVCDKEVCDPNICTKIENAQKRHSDKLKFKAQKETKHVKDSHTSFSSLKSGKKVAKHGLRRCFCKMKLASLIARGGVPESNKGFVAHVCDKEVCDPNKCSDLESIKKVHEQHSGRFIKHSSTDYRRTKSTSSVVTKPNRLKIIHSSEYPTRKRKINKPLRQVTATSSSPVRRFEKNSKDNSTSESSISFKKCKRKECWVTRSQKSTSTVPERKIRGSFIITKDKTDDKKHKKKSTKIGRRVYHPYDYNPNCDPYLCLKLKGRRKQHTRQTVTDRTKLQSVSSMTYASPMKTTTKRVVTKVKPHKNVLMKKGKSKKGLPPVLDLKIPRQTVRYGSNISFTIEFRKYTAKPNIYTVSKLSRNKCEWPYELKNVFKENMCRVKRPDQSIFNLKPLCKKSQHHRNYENLERKINLNNLPISLNCASNILISKEYYANESTKALSKSATETSLADGCSMANVRKFHLNILNKAPLLSLNHQQKAVTSVGSRVNVCLEHPKHTLALDNRISVLRNEITSSIKTALLEAMIPKPADKKIKLRYSPNNQITQDDHQTEQKVPIIAPIMENYQSPKIYRRKHQKETTQFIHRDAKDMGNLYKIINQRNQLKNSKINILQLKKSSTKIKNNSSQRRDIVHSYVPPKILNHKACEDLEKRNVISKSPITPTPMLQRCLNTAGIHEKKVLKNIESSEQVQQISVLKKCFCLLKV